MEELVKLEEKNSGIRAEGSHHMDLSFRCSQCRVRDTQADDIQSCLKLIPKSADAWIILTLAVAFGQTRRSSWSGRHVRLE